MTNGPTDPAVTSANVFPAPTWENWRELAETVLKGASVEERLVSASDDGITYGALHVRGGADPLPRTLRSDPGWLIAQRYADPEPDRLAKTLRDDIKGGVAILTLQMAATGQAGLAIDPEAVRVVLAAVPGDVQIHVDAGDRGIEALALFDCHPGVVLAYDPVGAMARTGNTAMLSGGSEGQDGAGVWQRSDRVRTIADGRPFHEAGGSEAQELAGLLGALVFHLRAAETAGVTVPTAMGRMALSLTADAELFMSIAKLRAARILVRRVGAACSAEVAARALVLDVTTSMRMITRHDLEVNMLRTTAACAAAAMGGGDTITVLPYTWALGVPDGFAHRIARNTHHVLREESGFGVVGDPAGGAWAVEHLTREIAETSWELFQRWEGEGGIVAALKSGCVQDAIGEVADRRAGNIASGRIPLIGTSAYPMLGETVPDADPWPVPDALASSPVSRPLRPIRLAAGFEAVRERARFAAEAPVVFMAAIGSPPEFGARSAWVRNVLAAGGIDANDTGGGFTNTTDVGQAFAVSGARVAFLCGTDSGYALLGEAAASLLVQAGASAVYVVGKPANADDLSAAGVTGFWFDGMDMIEALGALHDTFDLDRSTHIDS